MTTKRVFNTLKFLSVHSSYAHNVIVWHHWKTQRWSRISLVDELVVRMVSMRGLEFSDSGLALDKAAVVHLLTGRTRLPISVVLQLFTESLMYQDVRSISRGTELFGTKFIHVTHEIEMFL